MEKNNRIMDEQTQEKFAEILDELAGAVKKAGRAVFDLMVEKTADSAEDLVDKGVDNIKEMVKNENQKD